MQKIKYLAILGVFWFLLSGCRGEEQPVSKIVASDHVGASTPIAALPVFQEASSPEDLAELQINNCLECHTDKQRLIDTARSEEEFIKESSGVG